MTEINNKISSKSLLIKKKVIKKSLKNKYIKLYFLFFLKAKIIFQIFVAYMKDIINIFNLKACF